MHITDTSIYKYIKKEKKNKIYTKAKYNLYMYVCIYSKVYTQSKRELYEKSFNLKQVYSKDATKTYRKKKQKENLRRLRKSISR